MDIPGIEEITYVIIYGNHRRLRKQMGAKVRKKIIRIMLCICFCIGMILGCGAQTNSLSAPAADAETPEPQIYPEEDKAEGNETGQNETGQSKAEEVETGQNEGGKNETGQNEAEQVNALGMPLRDGTALLVTVTQCAFRGDFIWDDIVEEYEFDGEGRILRYINDGFRSAFAKRIEYEYDDYGSLIRETCYDPEWQGGNERYRIEYSYVKENNGDLAGYVECEYKEGDTLSRCTEYDGKGVLQKETIYSEGRIYSEYERFGNRMEKIIYDAEGNILNRQEEEYDDAGNLTLRAEYNAEGEIEVFEGYECDTYMVVYHYWTYENEYDDNGHLVRRVGYDYEGNESDIWEYVYDEAGNLLTKKFADRDVTKEGFTEEEAYEYDSAGNLVRESLDQRLSWEREYDRKNRPIKVTEYSYDGTIEYWYEFTYKTTGVVGEEDYPYDKINIRKYFY